jgi:cyanophycin synthetase
MMTNLLKLPEGRSTRLFGANLFFDRAGAVLDVHVVDHQDELVKLWIVELNRVLPAINWEPGYLTGHKKYSKGIRFALSAPYDLLWAATDLVEYIWLSVRHKFELGQFLSLEKAREHMQPIIEKHTSLVFRRVYLEAHRRSLNVFEDGTNVTVGSGKFAYTVAKEKLLYEEIPWDKIKEIPAVIVTGTNGKTTTVRLAHFICKMANKIAGYCSTDWIMIGDEIIEHGDLTGPSGNQGVMMNQNVEVAVLEVARGGLLRRGILTNFVRAATVTNVSVDHMGEDGVDTLEELALAKALVYKSIAPDGYAIVNLDDKLMREYSKKLTVKKIYITQDISNPDYAAYLADAAFVCHAQDNAFYWRSCVIPVMAGIHNLKEISFLKDKNKDQLIASFADTPITVNGNALHNVENALHAIALSFTLGNSIEHIAQALMLYENSAENNLGRANIFKYNGGTVIVDFAHNVAGMEAMIHLAKSYMVDDGRFGILCGNTGNRMYLTDKITDSIISGKPSMVIIKELSSYLRGTEPGELVRQMQGMLVAKGMDAQNIQIAQNEFEALDIALDFVKAGDVFLFLAHESTAKIIEKLKILAK